MFATQFTPARRHEHWHEDSAAIVRTGFVGGACQHDEMDTSSRNILATFVAATAPDRTPRCRERDAVIVEQLVHYLDHTDVAPHVGTDPAALLSLEREFGGPEGSFFRVFGVDELVCCLPGFLDTAPVPPAARVALVGRLLRWIWQGRMLGWNAGCAFHDAENAVARARREARARGGERRTP